MVKVQSQMAYGAHVGGLWPVFPTILRVTPYTAKESVQFSGGLAANPSRLAQSYLFEGSCHFGEVNLGQVTSSSDLEITV